MKTLEEYERQRKERNRKQKIYRARNRELCDAWRQTGAANYLRKKGWTVLPPPGRKTPEQIRQEREVLAFLNTDDFMDDLPL